MTVFDRTFVVNLDRRRDRWDSFLARFPSPWPFAKPERWKAVDGNECDVPDWFQAQAGAWGCMQSHLAIWREQIEHDWDAVLIFEDDAVFSAQAVDVIQRTMEIVPEDWDQIYFGGQHLDTNERPPEAEIPGKLVQCRYTNRTHAYAIRWGFAVEAYETISQPAPERGARVQHIDYRLGDMHDRYKVYAPWRFCVAQARGISDVTNTLRGTPKRVREHWWNQFPIANRVQVPV